MRLASPAAATSRSVSASNPGSPRPSEPTGASEAYNASSDLSSRVAALQWWHHIELAQGIVTPGTLNKAHQDWVTENLPARFDGLSVLDVGAWDGYYSFLVEERGARRVLAIDNLQNADAHRFGTAPFELARVARGSKVEYRVHDITKDGGLNEAFDCVLFLGVYYHLPNPWLALATIRRLLSPRGFVLLEGLLLPGSKSIMRFFESPELEATTSCAATERGLAFMARTCGFDTVERVARHAGMGSVPFALWRYLPSTMKAGGGLSDRSIASRLVRHSRLSDGAWPRILLRLTPRPDP